MLKQILFLSPVLDSQQAETRNRFGARGGTLPFYGLTPSPPPTPLSSFSEPKLSTGCLQVMKTMVADPGAYINHQVQKHQDLSAWT